MRPFVCAIALAASFAAPAASACVLLLLGSLASAQERAAEVKLADTLSVGVPPGWRVADQSRNAIEIHVPSQRERQLPSADADDERIPKGAAGLEATMLVTIEHRRDHAEAVRRLAEIASEYPERATPLLIAGWPAIERRYRAVMPRTGETVPSGNGGQTLFATTAIAAGPSVVRFNTMLAPDGDARLLDQALAIGRGLRAPEGPVEVSRRELEQIRRLTKPPRGTSAPPRRQTRAARVERPPAPAPKASGAAGEVVRGAQTGRGELEVATNDGQHVVIATNDGYSYSNDFGATWTFGGAAPCNQAECHGDPTVAVGQSGAIYYGWIGGNSGALGNGVSASTNNGVTFSFRGMAATCGLFSGCTLADQPHIAADRANPGSGGDRIYNVWRNFFLYWGTSIRISCSSNGGTSWTSGVAIGSGDHPRVSVGGDGFVYVTYASGANMMLQKYSSCDAGLTEVGGPITVAQYTNVHCPVPGLDRCGASDGRNNLSSPKVAIDDLEPTHVYYAFATSTAPATSTSLGNEDVMVYESTDGGASFPRSVRVNTPVSARRFMPWISTYGGTAVVSWYDRRTATLGNNDLARYFVGGAARRGPNLVALPETDLSGADDNQCSTWPRAPSNTGDSESCSAQPQLAGQCSGSTTRCDFSAGTCTCQPGRGAPKYGDYNGNAAGAGRLYSAWGSAVPPASVGGAAGPIRIYASAERIPSDFYVRDWNAAPSFDNGSQPSTNPVFWTTSDVWSQSTATPANPGLDGSVAGDAPSHTGSNFAYARISRRAPAASTAPPATVTAHFLIADFGLGIPFTPIGSINVTFAAGEMNKITPAHAWTVPVAASSHLCLAVQIGGPDGDEFALPSLAGQAPGPTGPSVVADNNKAQRNLRSTIATAAGTELIAIIGNSERLRRRIRLRVGVPGEAPLDGRFEVIGGGTIRAVNDARIDLGLLAPGEVRWLRFRATSLAGVTTPRPIDVFEDTNPRATGFTIMLQQAGVDQVAGRNLAELASVLARFAQHRQDGNARRLSELALRAVSDASAASYAAFLTEKRSALLEIVRQVRRLDTVDRFGIEAAARELGRAVAQRQHEATALAGTSLTERLDAQLTAHLRRRQRASTASQPARRQAASLPHTPH